MEAAVLNGKRILHVLMFTQFTRAHYLLILHVIMLTYSTRAHVYL